MVVERHWLLYWLIEGQGIASTHELPEHDPTDLDHLVTLGVIDLDLDTIILTGAHHA